MTREVDLLIDVHIILRAKWDNRVVRVVPDSDDVKLSGGSTEFEGTFLYADLAQSSELVTDFQKRTAAKIIKCFLHCSSKIITAQGGKIASFDGDRVMGVFIGDSKDTRAAKAALEINHAVKKTVSPEVKAWFKSCRESPFSIGHCVGIDTSTVLAVRAGQRGSNDLVWVGRAPNFAASLSNIRKSRNCTFITQQVYRGLDKSVRFDSKGKQVWRRYPFTWLKKRRVVYCSSHSLEP